MAQTPKTIIVDVGQIGDLIRRSNDDMEYWKAEATKAEAQLGRLREMMLGLKLWMVGWRDSLEPAARAQIEALIKEYDT